MAVGGIHLVLDSIMTFETGSHIIVFICTMAEIAPLFIGLVEEIADQCRSITAVGSVTGQTVV